MVMATRNGRVVPGAAFALGDLSPQRTTVTVERDGEVVALDAWVYGRRCLGSVKAAIDAIRSEFLAARDAIGIDEQGDSSDSNLADAAYRVYLRDVARALVPGLTPAEADAVAGDDDKAAALFRHLEFWGAAEEDAEADPPAVAGSQPTTEGSPRGSRRSTDPTTG